MDSSSRVEKCNQEERKPESFQLKFNCLELVSSETSNGDDGLPIEELELLKLQAGSLLVSATGNWTGRGPRRQCLLAHSVTVQGTSSRSRAGVLAL